MKKNSKIKVLLTGVIIFMASLASQNLLSQDHDFKEADEDDNGYGGLCCEVGFGKCDHPNGMTFDNSEWKDGLEFCP